MYVHVYISLCVCVCVCVLGESTVGHMADVLVGAKQQAEKIILEGYNFARQYVAMGDLLVKLGRKREEMVVLKRQVSEVSVRVCVCVCGESLFASVTQSSERPIF